MPESREDERIGIQPSAWVKPQRVITGGYTSSEVRHALWYILVAWIFGAAWSAIVSGGPFASFLAKYLHAGDAVYGLLWAIGPIAGVFFFIGSYLVERTGRAKPTFLLYVTLHRLLWLAIAAIPLCLPHAANSLKIWLVCLIIFLSAASANFGGAGWMAWVSTIIPRTLAGRYFGIRASFGLLSMVIATLGVTFLLDHYEGQGWVYALIFGIAALFGATDILLFIPVREIPRVSQERLPSLLEVVVRPWQHAIFRDFMLYTIVSTTAYTMMGPFQWKYCFAERATHGLGMNIQTSSLFITIIPWLMMAAVATFWGRAVDRFGPKPVLTVSALCHIVLPLGWMLLRPGYAWAVLILATLGGLTWPGIDQVNVYMSAKVFPEERRSIYVSSYNVLVGVATAAGYLLGGGLAALLALVFPHLPWMPAWMSHYQWVFAASMLLRLLAFAVFLPRLQLPSAATFGTVARAVAGDALTSVPQAVSRWRRRRWAKRF